jgi:hypothetical protein
MVETNERAGDSFVVVIPWPYCIYRLMVEYRDSMSRRSLLEAFFFCRVPRIMS